MMDDVSMEILLDHYKDPRNFGELDAPDIEHEEGNPSCGDQIKIEIQLAADDDTIDDIRFTGKGCAVSQAAASMLTEELKGESVERAREMGKREMIDLLGIEINPMRLKCALLALKITRTGAFGLEEWPNGDDEELA